MAKQFSDSFYHGKAWKQCRQQILRRDLYTCAECDSRASEVHHKIPLEPSNINDPSISLNPDNLISLCHDCHTKITKGCTGDIVDGYEFDEKGQVIKI